jgi:hypothetical protein
VPCQLEEENVSLQREMERVRVGFENELAKIQHQAHARDNYWKEKLRSQELKYSQVRPMVPMGLLSMRWATRAAARARAACWCDVCGWGRP